MIKRFKSIYNTKVMKIFGRIKLSIFRLIYKSNKLSTLYYLIFSDAFDRESKAVINGILRYEGEPYPYQQSSYLLRRSIHRLEKGLLMKPRRDIFALEYINDAIDCYEQLAQSSSGDQNDEVNWAHDVLALYFKVTGSHPIIDKARERFNSFTGRGFPQKDALFVPYARDINNKPPVDYESFLKLAYQRRSVRWYLPKPVPRELVDEAIKIASLSPSACNRQPFIFRIFDEPELVQKIAALPGGTTGFYQNFPMIVVLVGQLGAYASERDRHIIYIDGSLAAMSFMFALETLGLSSCAINWPDIKTKENKMADFLRLASDERVIMLISVGYPDPEGLVAYSQKKDLDMLRKYNS